MDSTRTQTDQHEVLCAAVALDYLIRNPCKGTFDIVAVQYPAFVARSCRIFCLGKNPKKKSPTLSYWAGRTNGNTIKIIS